MKKEKSKKLKNTETHKIPTSKRPVIKSVADWVEIDGGWHHIAITVNKDGWHRIYVDGKEPERRAEAASFDVALTPEQVQRYYASATKEDA